MKFPQITKVVSAGTNTMIIPLAIPGLLSGRIILNIVCQKFAPRSLAALITLSSILTNTL